jgi:hypothetical protein
MSKYLFLAMGLVYTSIGSARFFNATPQKVCHVLVNINKLAAGKCVQIYSDDNPAFQTKDVNLCMSVAEIVEDLKSKKTDHVIECMNSIANRPAHSMSELQYEMCEKLIDSKQSVYVLLCASHVYPKEILNICNRSIKVGAYKLGAQCLAAGQSFSVTDISAIEQASKCDPEAVSSDGKKPLGTKSMPEVISCIEAAAPASGRRIGVDGSITKGSGQQ